MVSDGELAKGVETLLRQSNPSSVTSLNGVVQQLEAKLGQDLSHKTAFIRDHITYLLRSHPQPNPHPQPHPQPVADHFALQNHPQFANSHPQHFHPHFALQQHHPLIPPQVQPPPVQAEANPQNVGSNASPKPNKSASSGTKRKGGAGGLNKVCRVSPELQAIVGEPTMSRTEIVKQLWAYIRKHNLQDPSNKRKIVCDDALRMVFEIDCTDMFKMNKLLAKHINPLEPTKESGEAKRLKVDVEPATEITEPSSPPVIISDALANFLGVRQKEVFQSEALKGVWEYIKVNRLEDPLNSAMILCDAKLQELFGCESISAVDIPNMLACNHVFKC